MEILFRDDTYIYFIDCDRIQREEYWEYQSDIENIKHLDNINPIYHITSGFEEFFPSINEIAKHEPVPVYFEAKDVILVKLFEDITITELTPNLKKTYTMVNLNLL